jgi:hypothetical protein
MLGSSFSRGLGACRRYCHVVRSLAAAPPSRRPVIRAETDILITSLLEVKHDLEIIQQEVHGSTNQSQRRAAAEMSLQPIGVLHLK